jgi:isopentenyl-diphosphate Delta-isomerase
LWVSTGVGIGWSVGWLIGRCVRAVGCLYVATYTCTTATPSHRNPTTPKTPIPPPPPPHHHQVTRLHYIADSDDVWGEHEIDYIFLAQKPGIQALLENVNPNEVGEVLFVDAAQLRAMLRRAELYRGEALSPQEAAEEAAEAARAEAAGEKAGSAVRGLLRFTPWSRAIMERFLFLWWEDVGEGEGKDLTRHCDRGRIHRMGRLDP